MICGPFSSYREIIRDCWICLEGAARLLEENLISLVNRVIVE